MDSNRLESISVSAVNTYFSRNGYVVPHTSEQDKTPLWDGQLFIYKKRDEFSNETFNCQIPIQIKSSYHNGGKFPNRTTHSVTLIDLNNYLEDGGLAFFKVLISNEKEQIYCAFLNKLELKRAIESAKGNASRTIELRKIPANYQEVLKEFFRIHIQRNNPIMDVSDMPAKLNALLTPAFDGELQNLPYLATHPIDFLIKTADNQIFYPGTGPVPLHYSEKVKKPVSVNNEVYYSSFEILYDTDGIHFIVDDILSLIRPYKVTNNDGNPTMGHFEVNVKPRLLSKYLQGLRFALALAKHKEISFGELRQDLPELNPDDKFFTDSRNNLLHWTKVNDTLTQLGVSEDLDLDNLSDDELHYLNILVKGIYDKQPISVNFNGQGLLNSKYSNLYIAVVISKNEDGTYQFLNIYDPNITISYRIDEKQRQITSIFSMLFEQENLPSNIIWGNLLPFYKKYQELNPDLFSRTTFDVLNLLRHYDKTPKPEIIDAAISLLEWMIAEDDDKESKDIHFLNLAQALKRKNGKLSDEITNKLLEISFETRKKDHQYACCVLLNEESRANYLWSKLSDQNRKSLETMPICNLLKHNNNG